MKSVDTNVIVRALVRDDPVQARRADEVLSAGAFVPLTVLLETGWLLRSRYALDRVQVVAALRSLLDLPNVAVDAATAVEWAIGRLSVTGDFADLMHIAASRGAESFVTFDKGVAIAAGGDAPLTIETLA